MNQWQDVVATLNSWAGSLTVLEMMAYGLLVMCYLVTGCFVAIAWWGKLSRGDDGAGPAMAGEETIVLVVLGLGGFILCAVVWPLVWVAIWLVKLCRVVAGLVGRDE